MTLHMKDLVSYSYQALHSGIKRQDDNNKKENNGSERKTKS